MGADKAEMTLEGRRLIELPLAVLDQIASRVVLATGTDPRYRALGREVVLDEIPESGPLAGLLAGLEAARTPWIAVLACDMPRARASVLVHLLERAQREQLDVCLLELERGSQPLYGVYHKRCAVAVRDALFAGERRMVSFYSRPVVGGSLRVGTVAIAEFGREASDCALNVNTPQDFEVERTRIGGAAS